MWDQPIRIADGFQNMAVGAAPGIYQPQNTQNTHSMCVYRIINLHVLSRE